MQARKPSPEPELMPIRNRIFHRLRCRMMEYGYDQIRLARKLGRSEYTITSRMCNHQPWTLEEMYTICDLLKIPNSELHLYFPKDGKEV